jgi:hypothetical protein
VQQAGVRQAPEIPVFPTRADEFVVGQPPPSALRFPTRPGGLSAGPPASCLLGWTYVERDSALLSVPIGPGEMTRPR